MACSYQSCTNNYAAGSLLSYFNLPKDERRPIWIKNSGNPELEIKEKLYGKLLFCEKHFPVRFLRECGTKKILAKNAVPKPYNKEIEDTSFSSEDKKEKISNEDEKLIVEEILDRRIQNGKPQYYIKWEGLSNNYCTWETEDNLEDCRDLISHFEVEKQKNKLKDDRNKRGKKNKLEEIQKPRGYSRGFNIQKIVGCTDCTGELMYLVKWHGCEELDLLPATALNANNPKFVINFYESRCPLNQRVTERNLLFNMPVKRRSNNVAGAPNQENTNACGNIDTDITINEGIKNHLQNDVRKYMPTDIHQQSINKLNLELPNQCTDLEFHHQNLYECRDD